MSNVQNDNVKKPTKEKKPKKKGIVFVCTGNTCRSAMMQYIFTNALKKRGLNEQFSVSSSGLVADVGADMPFYAREALKRLDIPFKKHKAKQTTINAVKRAFLVVCMTKNHKDYININDKCVTVAEITGGNDVTDPYGGGLDFYMRTAEGLIYASDEIIDYIQKKLS